MTADKSTNLRIPNQATLVCLIIDGKRQGIPLNVRPVYESSDGKGGCGSELAEAIFKDLEKFGGIKGEDLFRKQGKITDGQYLKVSFVETMNKPIRTLLEKESDHSEFDPFWWPCQ